MQPDHAERARDEDDLHALAALESFGWARDPALAAAAYLTGISATRWRGGDVRAVAAEIAALERAMMEVDHAA